jgi:hypothetical protein
MLFAQSSTFLHLQYAFGPKLGLWTVLFCQLVMMCGLGIVYSVTGGQAMNQSKGMLESTVSCMAADIKVVWRHEYIHVYLPPFSS